MLILLIALAVGTALLFGSSSSGGRFTRQTSTQESLAAAKSALIGYAASYRELASNPNRTLGYLPCVDVNNSGTQDVVPNCTNSSAQHHFGRLPFITLGLSPLKDSDGECLWYAVSGSYKNTNESVRMNWDLRGDLQIVDASNTILADRDDANGGAVAALFAPGAPLATQTRTGAHRHCPGDDTNAITSWLDEGAYSNPYTTSLPRVRMGAPGSQANNDQVAWITAKELWDDASRRSDLLGPNTQLLNELASCLDAQATLPLPSIPSPLPSPPPTILATDYRDDLTRVPPGTDGTKWRIPWRGIDRILAGQLDPAGSLSPACSWSSALAADLWDNWSDHVQYVRCKGSSPCLDVNGLSCSGALLFAGRSVNARPRTAAEMNIASSYAGYFEAPNAASLDGAGTIFAGNSAYDGSQPQRDLAYCLHPILNFNSPVATVANSINSSNLAAFDSVTRTLTLGASNVDIDDASIAELFACGWITDTLAIGDGFRAYFRFLIDDPGPGFTFAVVDALRNPTTNICGAGGRFLGYAGTPSGGPSPIAFPKLAVEFDTQYLNSLNDRIDPASEDDHMALVYWGSEASPPGPDDDNIHGAGPIDRQNLAAPNANLIEDDEIGANGKRRSVRVELHELAYDSASGIGDYRLIAWLNLVDLDNTTDPANVDPPGFGNLNVDFTGSGPNLKRIQQDFRVTDLSLGVRAFGRLRFGFTGANGNTDQVVRFTQFEARNRR